MEDLVHAVSEQILQAGVLEDKKTKEERERLTREAAKVRSAIEKVKKDRARASKNFAVSQSDFLSALASGSSHRQSIFMACRMVMPRALPTEAGQLIRLDVGSPLRKALEDHFYETTAQQLSISPAAKTFASKFAQKPDWTITNVYSCINHELTRRYSEYRNAILTECHNVKFSTIPDMVNPRPCGNGEYLLYHGCQWEVVDQILTGGFRKEFARDRPLFGRKNYFADHSSKSACYVRSDNGDNDGTGTFRMIVARVFLGKCEPEIRGNHNSVAPSPGYHSNRAVLKASGGSVYYPEYMVADNDGARPEYVIEFTHNSGCMCSQCELRSRVIISK